MKIENGRRLSIVLAASLVFLGWSQLMSLSESPSRWKWLQDMANNLLGQNGHAKLLIFTGVIWLMWSLVAIFGSSKGEK